MENKSSEEKEKEYLYNMYNATSTDDGTGEIETYEAWLERQLIKRIEIILELQQENKAFERIIDDATVTIKELEEENNKLKDSQEIYSPRVYKEKYDFVISEIRRLEEEINKKDQLIKEAFEAGNEFGNDPNKKDWEEWCKSKNIELSE